MQQLNEVNLPHYSDWKWDEGNEIIDGVFLGGIGSCRNLSYLKKNKITHILTVANKITPSFPKQFKYHVISIRDEVDENISQYFQATNEFIDEAREKGGVLVHCHAGASRSATIVIAYLMTKFGYSLDDSLNFTVLRRPIVSPNYSFLQQLVDYENDLLPQNDNNLNTIVDNPDNIDIIEDKNDIAVKEMNGEEDKLGLE